MDPAQKPPASRPQGSSASKSLFPVDSDTHLLDRLNAIYKYRYVVITIFLLVMLGVAMRTYTTTPMYRATTSVLIEDDRAATVAGFNAATTDFSQDPEPYYQTQLRILMGRELATKVVEKLHLENLPQFNGQSPKRTGLAAAFDSVRQQGKRALGKVTGAAEIPAAAAGKPTTPELVNQFLGTVGVDQVRGSRLVNVSVTSSDPAFESRAADTLVEEYVQFNLEFRTDATRKSLDFLASEIAKQQAKVEASERAMAEYRENNNALSLEDRQNTVVANLNSVNDQYTRTRSERIQKEAVYNQIRNLPASGLADSPPSTRTRPSRRCGPGLRSSSGRKYS